MGLCIQVDYSDRFEVDTVSAQHPSYHSQVGVGLKVTLSQDRKREIVRFTRYMASPLSAQQAAIFLCSQLFEHFVGQFPCVSPVILAISSVQTCTNACISSSLKWTLAGSNGSMSQPIRKTRHKIKIFAYGLDIYMERGKSALVLLFRFIQNQFTDVVEVRILRRWVDDLFRLNGQHRRGRPEWCNAQMN